MGKIIHPQTNNDPLDSARMQRLVEVAANVGNDNIARLLHAFEEWWYPERYADIIPLGASQSVTIPYQFPGVFSLHKLELWASGGTYPTLVDVTIARFSALPLSMTQQTAIRGPYAFPIIGSSDVTFSNLDSGVGAAIYIEWEMVRYGRNDG